MNRDTERRLIMGYDGVTGTKNTIQMSFLLHLSAYNPVYPIRVWLLNGRGTYNLVWPMG